jgi:hypothetical protein
MKEEIAYFTEMFHDLLRCLRNHFNLKHLIFWWNIFENIAKLENVFNDTNLKKNEWKQRFKTFHLHQQDFLWLHPMFDLKAAIKVNDYLKY